MRRLLRWLLPAALLLVALMLGVGAGSVAISPGETLSILSAALRGEAAAGSHAVILLSVRLPRVLCVALAGASLSLCGAAMQGLLRNPLADGSTLGVSSGASLGAVLSLAFGLRPPFWPEGGVMAMAMLFAFLSLVLILSLSLALDRSLQTGSIILLGVIFSMFATSCISLVTAFAGEKIKSITFWTMGSLSGSTYRDALVLCIALVLCGGVLLRFAPELNAFSMGEEEAAHLGVAVRGVKLTVLIAVSVLIGVCVSIGGTISFVGLVMPHMARMLSGPDHRRLLGASMVSGAIFLVLTDLVSRTIVSPMELPVGVVTSLIGAVAFVVLFRRTKGGRAA